MKTQIKRIDLKSALLGGFVGVSIMLSVAAATTSGNRTNWEYVVVQGTVLGQDISLGNDINKQAAQGWEYVSASPSKDQYGFAVMRRERK